ncbi:MAG: hypothetical protein ACSHYB_17115 [Roseibacillus sp.]
MAGRIPQEETITIKLSRLDLGQVLEGMSCRQQEWQQTADWHSGKLTAPPKSRSNSPAPA